MKDLGNKNKSKNFDSLSERIANFEAVMTAEKEKTKPSPNAGRWLSFSWTCSY